MNTTVTSRVEFEGTEVKPGSLVIQFADPELSFAKPKNPGDAKTLSLHFHDISEPMKGFVEPTVSDAHVIWTFLKENKQAPHLYLQCEAGVGRSQAVAAAIRYALGDPSLKGRGTYNRLLFGLMLKEMGINLPVDPLVGIAVRVKYPLDRAQAFCLSLLRQRYTNWRCVFMFDGTIYKDGLSKLSDICLPEDNFRFISTKEALGKWGNPHRQEGIDYLLDSGCRYVGVQNDDNYLTPGFLEQMVFHIQITKARMAICNYVNSYSGWESYTAVPKEGFCDLCCFLAHRDLVKEVKWPGDDFSSDSRYIEALAAKSINVVHIPKPLVVKN